MKNADVYAKVFADVTAAMQQGVTPWVRPWVSGASPSRGPVNAATGRPYSGGNIPALWLAAMAKGYTTDGWVTFKQALAAKAAVRKGEKATPVYYMSQFTPKRKDADTRREGEVSSKDGPIFLARLYYVFNLDQLDGEGLERLRARVVGEPSEAAAFEADAACEATVAATGAHITHGGDRAFYTPALDRITMPVPEAFPAPGSYYATLFHELGHWTGHETRLDRKLTGVFGTPEYAFEELVAELTAAFLAARHGIHHVTQSASYLANWAKACTAEPTLFPRAASMAQRAADHIAPAPAGVVTEEVAA
jgi:antirestriction protein ArdC